VAIPDYQTVMLPLMQFAGDGLDGLALTSARLAFWRKPAAATTQYQSAAARFSLAIPNASMVKAGFKSVEKRWLIPGDGFHAYHARR